MIKINYSKLNIFTFSIIIILLIIFYYINNSEHFNFRIYKSSSNSSSKSSSPVSSVYNTPSTSTTTSPIGTLLRIPLDLNMRNNKSRNSLNSISNRHIKNRRNNRINKDKTKKYKDKIIINNTNNNNNNKFLDEPLVDNYPYTYGTYPYPLLGYNNYYNNGLFYYDDPFSVLPMNSYDMINIPIYQSYQDDIVPNYRDTYSSIGNYNYYNNRFPPPVQDWCWKIISYKDFNLVPTASRKQWIEKAKKYNFNHIQFPRDRTDYILVPTWEISECYINKFGDDSMFQEVLLE